MNRYEKEKGTNTKDGKQTSSGGTKKPSGKPTALSVVLDKIKKEHGAGAVMGQGGSRQKKKEKGAKSSSGTGKYLKRAQDKKAYVASAFDVAHDNGLRTGLFSSKDKFVVYDLSYNERSGKTDTTGEDNGKDKLDDYHHNDKTEELIKTFTDSLKKDPYGLSMLHLRDPDTSGHAHGWDITSKSIYIYAVSKMDWIVGKLLEFIESNEKMKGKTALILTADHGGRLETKTHTKSDEKLNFTIPFIFPFINETSKLW